MSHSTKAETPILVVDAFTSEPFQGNPAGVVLLDKARDETWMQALAAEMKHAETAFLLPESEGFHLRWFTPVTEVDLCGHATLASAHALWETGTLKSGQEARFRTRSGVLTARQTREGIELDFPAQPPEPVTGSEGDSICAAMGQTLGTAGCGLAWNGVDYLLELNNEAAVRGLKPDFARIATIGARGIMVTAKSDSPEYDFVSRFFAPAFGIDEDPVTGSAHCALGPYWGAKLGKTELVGYQASPRGGTVRVVLRDDRVALVGKAVTVLRGTVAV